eukprot:121927-Hanusia_phi.AAC.1
MGRREYRRKRELRLVGLTCAADRSGECCSSAEDEDRGGQQGVENAFRSSRLLLCYSPPVLFLLPSPD